MTHLAIQSVTPTLPGQTLAAIAQGQNPIESALFGALMGGFAEPTSAQPNVAVGSGVLPLSVANSAIQAPLPSTELPSALAAQPTPADTLGLLSSSIQTATDLSTTTGTAVMLSGLPANTTIEAAVTPSNLPATAMTEGQLLPMSVGVATLANGLAAPAVALESPLVTVLPNPTNALPSEHLVPAQPVLNSPQQVLTVQIAQPDTVKPVQPSAGQATQPISVLIQPSIKAPTQLLDGHQTEFQRLSGQKVKSEGDVAISPVTGQPFFNLAVEPTAPIADQQVQAATSAVAQPVVDTTTLVSNLAVNPATQTMVHQVVAQPSVAVDSSNQPLTTAVSLGNEQVGAPVFATNTASLPKESALSSVATSHMDTNNISTLSSGITASTQQLNLSQQQSQSNQQQSDARQNGALLSDVRTSASDASASTSDVDGFATMLNGFSTLPSASLMTNPLATPVSLRHPQWTQDMGNRMHMMVSQRMKEVEIKLDPAELGPVRIHLKMDAENKAHVTLSAQHGLTRDMLENALPRLRDMLSQQGVEVGSTNVDSGAQQQAFNQQQSSEQNKSADSPIDAANPISEAPLWKSVNGLVDHFA